MNMKILLVVDETSFYHPSFVNELIISLKEKKNDIFGGIVTKIEKKNNIELYIRRNFHKLYLGEILVLFAKKVFFTILNKLFPYGFKNNFFSVKSVFKKHKVPFFKIENNINTEENLQKIKNLKLDLIISSNSLYFGSGILNLPKLGCINRHTSLLPSYGGVWPVLHAIANDEKEVGVTVHQMTRNMDIGKVLAQKKISITGSSKNLSDIYKKAFLISHSVVLDAIDNLIQNKNLKFYNYPSSYFSFPDNNDWINFRNNGGKFV